MGGALTTMATRVTVGRSFAEASSCGVNSAGAAGAGSAEALWSRASLWLVSAARCDVVPVALVLGRGGALVVVVAAAASFLVAVKPLKPFGSGRTASAAAVVLVARAARNFCSSRRPRSCRRWDRRSTVSCSVPRTTMMMRSSLKHPTEAPPLGCTGPCNYTHTHTHTHTTHVPRSNILEQSAKDSWDPFFWKLPRN